jgi:hypothetical protein
VPPRPRAVLPNVQLVVARAIQNRTGLAVRNVIRQLRPLSSATIAINGVLQTFPPAIDLERQTILDALAGKALTE